MIRRIERAGMGRGEHGWLDSHFHFSFADYYNPDNMNFGALRVLNDDLVQPGAGFDTHPHRNMEIISYVVDGELTHADSMGHKRTLTRGQAQYMSAGTGVLHSEYNLGGSILRFLQIWIIPDKEGYPPNYGDVRFEWEDRAGKWLPIASGNPDSPAPIKIHADANVFAAAVSNGEALKMTVGPGRQVYAVMIEGEGTINGAALAQRDAAEIVGEDFTLAAGAFAHALVIEMAEESA